MFLTLRYFAVRYGGRAGCINPAKRPSETGFQTAFR